MEDLFWLKNHKHTPVELRRIAWQSYKHDRKAFSKIMEAAESLEKATRVVTVLCDAPNCVAQAHYHLLNMGSNWCERHFPEEHKFGANTVYSKEGFFAV